MKRSSFIKNVALLSGGLMTTRHLLAEESPEAQLENNPQDSLRTDIEYYSGVDSYIKCFTARPDTDATLPGIILIHGLRGLNKHYVETAKKLAAEGFCIMAPDALSPLGGTLGEMDENRSMLMKLKPQQNDENFRRGINYLKEQPNVSSKIAVVGFGWGGMVANRLAIRSSNLAAVVSYYGKAPQKDVGQINVPLLLHYAAQDEQVNKDVPAFESALKSGNKDYQLEKYPRTKNGFNNNSLKAKYNKVAADKAWATTLAFLRKRLNS
ncbi:MAG: dienelactone hydrolase family protein [Roseivirga sp.]